MPVQDQVTLTSMLEESLDILYRSIQRPMAYTLGATDLDAAGTVKVFQVADEAGSLNVGDILEIALEQLRITAVDTANPRNITAVRAFAGTPAQDHSSGDTVLVNPDWYRYSVYRALLRGLKGAIPKDLPNMKTTNFSPTQDQFYEALPADCIKPMRVAYIRTDASASARKFRQIDEWNFEDDVDPSVAASGCLITLPIWLCNNVTVSSVTVYVTYQAAYLWTVGSGGSMGQLTSTPSEDTSDYIELDTGSTDLAPLYAAAYLTANREITRLDLNKIEEWSSEAAIRQGNNMKLIQMTWNEFYRRLDEARRIKTYAKHRPFRPMHRSQSYMA